MLESILARIQVVERLDLSLPENEHSCSSDASSHSESGTQRVLYTMFEAALARITILESRRGISYGNGFKATNAETCVVRGCERTYARPDSTIRHLKDSSHPQHQVAAIVMGQTWCLQCDEEYHRPTYLKDHEANAHKEAYTSRIDMLSPFLEDFPRAYA